MDGGEGPSKPKRSRKTVNDCQKKNVNEEYCDLNKIDNFPTTKTPSREGLNVYTHDEFCTAENLCDLIDIKEELIGDKEFSRPLSPCHIKEELDGDTYKDDSGSPSATSCMSQWTTICELKDIPFDKQNEFWGVPDGQNPIDYYNFFFCNNFLEMICSETNKQAERLALQDEECSKSQIKRWKELTVPELRVFLGLLFHMDTIKISRPQDYWRKDRLFSIPIFGEQMKPNRFLLILRYLHFTSVLESNNPFVKICLVVDYFNNKMNECYYPARELSIDEIKILGRLKFRHYIRNVGHMFVTKLYTLTEPDGLVLKLQVYTSSQDRKIAGKDKNSRIREKVVMQLLQEKLNHGHSVYMDKFYNSFQLFKLLLDNNTYCTGKLCKNLKDNPKEVVQSTLKKGENVSYFQDGVHIGMWKDIQPVAYITTQYENEMVPVLNKCGEMILKPKAIAKYNEVMSVVDRHDQLQPYYPSKRNTYRWYLKIGLHVFQLLFMNSYKIYNKYSGQPEISYYDYRLSVIDNLLPLKQDLGMLISSRPFHKISKIQEKNSRGKTKRKLCRQCSKKSTRKDTIWHCLTCVEKPGLCVECFNLYHSQI